MESLKPQQSSLVVKAMQVARQLQTDCGDEIKQLYRDKKTHPDIVTSLSIIDRYGIKKSTAITAVQLALRGYRGYFGVDSCSGLLSESELERIAKEHLASGYIVRRKNKQGIFGWSKERLHEFGKTHGENSYRHGKGIHGMTQKQKTDAGILGGTVAAEKRGQELWNRKGLTEETRALTEIERAYQLTTRHEYKYENGRYEGKPIIPKVLATINLEYHAGQMVRTKRALERALEKYRKNLKED